MKKIVIISRWGRINHELISFLTALFPDCDISIVSDDPQDLEPCPGASFSMTTMADETGY
jgi:hypothetical protein